jgi:tRNA pseudouridine38-40 synthase
MTHRNGVLLRVAYDGSAFSGWAAQEGARTIEDTLRTAIAAVDANASPPRGASRTDAGVHAKGQAAAFDAALPIEPRGWVLALNSNLPDDVAIRAARIVPIGYNPRFESKGKRYRYRLLLDQVRDPLHAAHAWRVGFSLELARMHDAARRLVGTHDFAAFRTSRDERTNTERTLRSVDLVTEDGDPRLLSVVVDGSAFLHNMIRILVGTLVDVGRGRLEPDCIDRAFASHDRAILGSTAPAHGLILEEVLLDPPAEGSDAWPR